MGFSTFPAVGAASKWQRTQVITSTQSWVAPADVASVEVILCGGGGGGGPMFLNNSGFERSGGGGGGSIFYSNLTVTPSTSYTVTIGAGGSAGGTWQATNPALPVASVGASSTFGALLTAVGGGAGTDYKAGPGAGLGGGGASGSWKSYASSNYYGSYESYTVSSAGTGSYGYGGGGGASSPLNEMTGPGSSGGATPTVASGAASANSGSGGAGALRVSGNLVFVNGGAGGSGIAIIKYWSAL